MLDSLTNIVDTSLAWSTLLLFTLGSIIGLVPRTEKIIRGFTTYTHEMGHALVAVALGRKVSRIVVSPHLGGHTSYVGKRGLGNILISWSGYAAPGTLLLLLSLVVYTGALTLIGSTMMAIVAVTLLLQRSFSGIVYSIVALGYFALVLTSFASTIEQGIIFLIAGILLGNGMGSAYLLHKVRKSLNSGSREKGELADSEYLEQWSGLPARLWEYSWIAYMLFCIVVFVTVSYL